MNVRMAPTDRIQLPFRWVFAPMEEPVTRAVRWTWRAYTQAGRIAQQSAGTFETLTECMEDAKENGYGTHQQ
jgi:hypothetical protein